VHDAVIDVTRIWGRDFHPNAFSVVNWKCPKCGEVMGYYAFQVCWNCEEPRAHSPPVDVGEPVHDPDVGAIYWDSELNCWIGTCPTHSANPYILRIDSDEASSRTISPLQKQAFAALAPELPTLVERATKIYAASDPFVPDDLYERLLPCVVRVMKDGVIEAWFEDVSEYDYFAQHALVFQRKPDDKVEVFSDYR
jgi:hypothetical protein